MIATAQLERPKAAEIPPLIRKQREIIVAAEKEARKKKGFVNLVAAQDPATDYAAAVLDGSIPAGEFIRLACQRHMIDIHRKDLIWDKDAGDAYEDYCKEFTVMRDPLTGDRHPFVLLDWQKFAARSTLCWKVKDGDILARLPGTRRFRKVFILSGKGNGKTPWVSSMELYLLQCGPEYDFEGYNAGAKIDQALIGMQDMGDFLRHMDDADQLKGLYTARELAGRGKKVPASPYAVLYESQGKISKIVYFDRNGKEKGYIEAVGASATGKGASGPRPCLIVYSEIHEATSRDLLNLLEQGTKFRTEPLTMLDTNAGKDVTGPAHEERDKVISMLRREHDDDTLFGLLYEVDADDEPLIDESCWGKANPSLSSGQIIRKDYIRGRIVSARTPFDEAQVLRLNFGRWINALALPFKADDWDKRLVKKINPPKDAWLFGALDLAGLKDMTALAYVWLLLREDRLPKFYLKVDYWWNQVALDRKPEEKKQWLYNMAEQGYINLASGNINDNTAVAARIKELEKQWRGISFDPYKMAEMRLYFKNARVRFHEVQRPSAKPLGIPFWRHPQGSQQERGINASPLWMDKSIRVFTDALLDNLDDRIEIENNPVLTWNTGTARMDQDRIGNLFINRPSKDPKADNIDGFMASLMAVGLAAFIAEGGQSKPTGLSKALLED